MDVNLTWPILALELGACNRADSTGYGDQKNKSVSWVHFKEIHRSVGRVLKLPQDDSNRYSLILIFKNVL